MAESFLRVDQIAPAVNAALSSQKIVDMHTHVYAPCFGTPVKNAGQATDPTGLLLWGIDEMLTYHYLVAEAYRIVPASKLPYEKFWAMPKQEQANHVWKQLFVERSPISESTRGLLTSLQRLGLDPYCDGLEGMRKYFAEQKVSDYIDRVMELANISKLVMTNAVFDDNERNRWLANPGKLEDSRFPAVVRIDPMLRNWPVAAKTMASLGYNVSAEWSEKNVAEARRFLVDWIERTKAIYVAISLPPSFRYPAGGVLEQAGQCVLEQVVLPVCGERRMAVALMIGCESRVNPALGDAGDMVGKSDIMSVVHLCQQFPQNKFYLTMLARENQHEMAIAARKFGNLMIFGCWWFLNSPSMIEEIIKMRMEWMGTTFIPQHSDARVLEQTIYKWDHTKVILGKLLSEKYALAVQAGGRISKANIERDVRLFLQDNFLEFLNR